MQAVLAGKADQISEDISGATLEIGDNTYSGSYARSLLKKHSSCEALSHSILEKAKKTQDYMVVKNFKHYLEDECAILLRPQGYSFSTFWHENIKRQTQLHKNYEQLEVLYQTLAANFENVRKSYAEQQQAVAKEEELRRKQNLVAEERKLEGMRKKYGIVEPELPRTDFLLSDYRLKGKNYILEIQPINMINADYYKALCNNMPCFVGSQKSLANFQTYRIIGRIVGFDFMIINHERGKVPIILLKEFVE